MRIFLYFLDMNFTYVHGSANLNFTLAVINNDRKRVWLVLWLGLKPGTTREGERWRVLRMRQHGYIEATHLTAGLSAANSLMTPTSMD